MSQSLLDLVDQNVITREFPAVCVRQPIGDIYVATIDFENIQRMTHFDVRRRIEEERDIERYLGIQRPLNQRRVEELNDYVNYKDASFPSSIVIAAPSDYAWFDTKKNKIILSNTRKGDDSPSIIFSNLCRVIDGQHRIAGLSKFRGENFDLIASIFIGSDISDQAYVFATINLEQTKVNRSLAVDLFELAKTRSPYKTCHNIAVAFDRSKENPFFEKIKRLGISTEGRYGTETITQATFVDGLLQYISKDPKLDRDLLLRNKKIDYIYGEVLDKYVFRNLFIDKEDIKIGKIYEQYFLAVQQKWPKAWNNSGTGIILPRTNGYRALSSVFGKTYRKITAPGNYAPASAFLRYFDKVEVDWNYFHTDNFKPGSSGESELRRLFTSKMDL